MNTNRTCNKILILSFLLTAMLNAVIYSQGTDSRRRPGGGQIKRLCMTLYVNPAMTTVSPGEITGLTDLSTISGKTLHGALDLDYFFSPAVGISFGVGYNGFSSQLALDSWSGKYSTQDSESETYEMRISGEKITEDQKIAYISIPLCLSIRIPADRKFGLYLKGGVGFDIPMVKSYEGTGVFSYAGYYPAYPVLLENIAEYGFAYKKNTSSTGTLELKSFSPAIIATGGIFFSLGANVQILLGGYYNKSLSAISSYETGTSFMLSSKADELKSIMSGSPGASFQALGVNVGLRFLLK